MKVTTNSVFDPRVKTVIGMVHLPALPGSPRFADDLEKIITRAETDAVSLIDGGINGIIVENYGDVPFYPEQVPPITVACMTTIVSRIRRLTRGVPVGVNVLRNDSEAGLAIATATKSHFIRVNVHCGAMVTDQGILSGKAYSSIRLRNQLCPKVAVFADVHVKHGIPIVQEDIVLAARDTLDRGLADGIIISGAATGSPVDIDTLARVRQEIPSAYVMVGSGVTEQTLPAIFDHCNAVIVGTALKNENDIKQPVAQSRVERLIAIARKYKT